MTTKRLKALKGWSIGVGTAMAIGTVTFLSSSTTKEEKALEDIYTIDIVWQAIGDSLSSEAPTIFDASVLSDMPIDSIKQSIIENRPVDGIQFRKRE